LKPGTRVVSNSFSMGEWEADQTLDVDGRTAYLWYVPAKVEGTWALKTNPGSGILKLSQEFQIIQGTLTLNGKERTIADGKLEGDQIRFTADNNEYTGRVNGKTIEGTVKKAGSEETWSAFLQQTNP